MNMRILFKCLLGLGAIFLSCEARANITIALVTPKAGDYAQQGLELEQGVQKAVNEINDEGGLLGKRLNLLTIDDQCNDGIAVSTAQMLTILKDKNISLIIGPYCANSFDKVADIYARAQLFQIIPTTVNYTQARTIKKGLVKMLGYTNQQAKDFFEYYNAEFAGEKVALISNINDAESVEMANTITEEFRKHGKSVVLKNYTYDMTNKNYTELAKIIMNDGNSIAFVSGLPKNIRKMAAALKKRDASFKIFANKYEATPEYFEYMDELANGTYFMALSGKEDDPEFAETLVKLRLSGFEAEGLSLYGYSAVKLWEAMVKETDSFEYNKLSTVVNNKNIKTEFGNQMFHNGAPTENEHYAIYKYVDGNYEKVY